MSSNVINYLSFYYLYFMEFPIFQLYIKYSKATIIFSACVYNKWSFIFYDKKTDVLKNFLSIHVKVSIYLNNYEFSWNCILLWIVDHRQEDSLVVWVPLCILWMNLKTNLMAEVPHLALDRMPLGKPMCLIF